MGNAKIHESILLIQDNLLRFAYSLTANKDDARDLLQDTTLKVLDNEDKYIENTNFKGWAMTVMRNIFINNYRKMMRSQTVIDNSEDLFQLNVNQKINSISAETSYSEKEIKEIISSFPPEYRLPISMHIAGYKYDEIAQKLHLPIGTVKSRIFMIRRKLQTLLKDFR